MILYAEFIMYVFRIINSAIIVGLGIYIFKKKLLPRIYERIDAQETTIRELHTKAHELEQYKNEVDAMVHDDEKLCAVLQQKIIQWNAQVAQDRLVRDKEKEEYIRFVHERVQQQNMHVTLHRASRLIIPQVLKRTEQELCTVFADPAVGVRFTTYITNYITKEYSIK